MQIQRTDALPFDPRGQLSRVFVEGFYDWLKHFSKDRDKLIAVFAHVFTLKYFYVALDGEKIAAMAACTGGFSPIRLERAEFVRVLGFFRGNITYCKLKRHMVRNSYPFSLGRGTGSIEFVATDAEFRNQGLGERLLTHIMTESPYDAHILEVAENNPPAVRLYEKLGFREFKRIKAPRRSGVGHFIYMRAASE